MKDCCIVDLKHVIICFKVDYFFVFIYEMNLLWLKIILKKVYVFYLWQQRVIMWESEENQIILGRN